MAHARMAGPRKCHPWCKPGRHVFTREECQRGFWAAIDSIVTRYPDAVDGSGSHMACKFLRKRNPLWFAARQLRVKADKMVARDGHDAIKLAELKQGLAQLEQQARGASQRATERNRGGSQCPRDRPTNSSTQAARKRAR